MAKELILEIDAGNTAVKWRLLLRGEILLRNRASYLDVFTQLESMLLLHRGVSVARLVSVAGVAFDSRLKVFLSENYSLHLAIAGVESSVAGVKCAYEQTSQLGVDRWMAILSAAHSSSGAKVVVDLGTALTIDFISVDHRHLGGYIVPGWGLMRLALENGTQINHDRIPNKYSADTIKLGKNTFDAIGMGRLKLLSSVIESAYVDFLNEQKGEVVLICTGGDAGNIIPHLSIPSVLYIEDLVLDGLSVAMQGVGCESE